MRDDEKPLKERMRQLTATLKEQFAGSARLGQTVRENLKGPDYGF